MVHLWDQTLETLDGGVVQGSQWKGSAVLFVNVASRCGFTSQYEGLQALHEEWGERGVVVVGVPCNQFGAQEPGSAQEIQTFCSTRYGVSFVMLAKQDVNGPQRSGLYEFLIGDGEDIRWNFEKILVSAKGEVVERFSSRVAPQSAQVREALEGAVE